MSSLDPSTVLSGEFGSWLWSSFVLSIELTLSVLSLAVPLSMLVALLRLSGTAPARAAGYCFVEAVRNVPLVAYLLFWYFGAPQLLPERAQSWLYGHDAESVCAVVALTLYTAAFMAEDVRSGIRTIPATQLEASRAMGLTYLQSMRLVILPQAVRVTLPPLISQTLSLWKNTSIATVIGTQELMYQAQRVETNTFRGAEVFAVTTAAYLTVSCLITTLGIAYRRRYPPAGIIGRSGAGKSTLLRTINLLERPTAGTVRIAGTDVTALDGEPLRLLRQRIGIIFQHFNLLSSKTVHENVRLPLRVAGGLDRKAQNGRVAEVLDLVGLSSHARKYPEQLSGGERQRVGIARALANHPEILLCDEATSALDPQTTQSILQLLVEINQRLGLTIVLITHGMDVIRTVADRVAILDRGHIVEYGKVIEVFLNPHHAVTRALLAESGIESDPIALRPGDAGHLLRLTYHGAQSERPLLTKISRESGLDFAIVQASVGRLKDVPYGRLVVRTPPLQPGRLESLLNELHLQGVQHEVLR